MLSRLRPGAAWIAAAVTAGHGRRTTVPSSAPSRWQPETHAGRPKLFNLLNIDGRLAPLIDAVRLRGLNAFELAFRLRFVSNSAKTPSMSRKALPAALEVSIGCSVA